MFKKIFAINLLIILVFTVSSCRIKGTEKEISNFSGIVLNYYKMNDDRTVIEPIIAEYVQKKKGLVINYKSFDDFDVYIRTILNEMAEGEGPDIFSMPNSWFASNYKKLSSMPSDYGSLNDFDSLFVDVASKDLIQVDNDGVEKIFAIPMTVDTLAIYYNKSHFEDRIPTQGKPSNTWDGILNDVVQLNKFNFNNDNFEVSGIAMGTGSNISNSVDILFALMQQAGVSFYDDKMSITRFASTNAFSSGKTLLDILNLYSGFADFSKRNYSWNFTMADSKSELKEIESFINGNVSMIIGYSDLYEKIVKEINNSRNFRSQVINVDDVRIAPFPQLLETSGTNFKRVAYANYFAETVSRNTNHADIAWDFLVFLTQKNNLQNYFDKTKKPTSRRDMIEDQMKNPIYGVFASQIGYAESFPIVDIVKYREYFVEMLDFIAEGGDKTRAYKEVETQINKLLPSSGFKSQKIN